ncbi:glycosyltransferase [Rhodococcus sp. DMU2021]|uniref:glycosyltransferase n=1 Tax=Rhodococcus sp. DMU2021 TaxID=2866997 RepID=UPI001C7D64DE|nr:glycosyltransferase [Rhodococcus sp. DMU2021]MBX4170570.1 glycosyltransferase [Rhodococcus sp. DMU2021]
MKKSVAIIGTRGYPSYYGGFETLIRHLAPYLSSQGWDVTVYGRDGATKTDDPELDPTVRTVVTKGIESKSLSTLSYGLSSSLHASSKKPDVALIMNVANGYWLPILKARGIPTVVNVDGIEWERAKWGKKAKAAFKVGARLTAKFADRIVVDSRAIGQRWEDEFNRHGDFIPYGGSRPGALKPVEGLIPGTYALIVARFVPENSVEEFFDAAKHLAKDRDVVIVGSSGYGGALDEKAKRLAQESSRIHWLGHVSDDTKLFSLWQHAGVYFHGHSVGGTNPALVQAMACGAPIVARDTPFNREVLGIAGEYVAPSPEQIIYSLRRVLDDRNLQENLRTNALDRQAEEYTWDLVCKGYEASLISANKKI